MSLRLTFNRKRTRLNHGMLCLIVALPLLAGCGDDKSVSAPADSEPGASATGVRSRRSRSGIRRDAENKAHSETAQPLAPLAASPHPHVSDSAAQTQPAEKVQPVYRPSDTRPVHDDRRLAKFGIHRYESKHLKLYTDIAPGLAKPLPPLLDQAYRTWEDYLGKLPPDREGSVFQITGYLMSEKELFRRVGLLPADLRAFVNGRHRGAEFWMVDQEHDYYRRHLMIHEATHCYMTIMPDTRAPVWYLEGIAEQFGTHRIDADGTAHFRVMPGRKGDFAGLGRITMIQQDVGHGRFQTLRDVFGLEPNAYLQNEAYAWSWAVCEFLGKHPRYRDRFRELSRHLTGSQFAAAFRDFLNEYGPALNTEWPLFAHQLQHGYDHGRAAIEFRAGQPLPAGSGVARVEIVADKGWQSSGVLVEEGRAYTLTAQGRFTLAQKPKPWISEPQGISFRYSGGRPLGMLLATIRARAGSDGTGNESMLRVIPIGRRRQFVAPTTGALYLRLNDSWSELQENTGRVQVEIQPESPHQN